jgi:hypothetical protein
MLAHYGRSQLSAEAEDRMRQRQIRRIVLAR